MFRDAFRDVVAWMNTPGGKAAQMSGGPPVAKSDIVFALDAVFKVLEEVEREQEFLFSAMQKSSEKRMRLMDRIEALERKLTE